MKSNAYFVLTAFVLLCSAAACQFNTAGRSTEENARLSAQDTIPDNIGEQDLLDILQGAWDADSFPNELLVVKNDSIWLYDNRALLQKGKLLIDSHCSADICFDSLLQENWCFIVDDRQEQQCYRVLKCSPDSLHFHAAGSDGRMKRYHRKP